MTNISIDSIIKLSYSNEFRYLDPNEIHLELCTSSATADLEIGVESQNSTTDKEKKQRTFEYLNWNEYWTISIWIIISETEIVTVHHVNTAMNNGW